RGRAAAGLLAPYEGRSGTRPTASAPPPTPPNREEFAAPSSLTRRGGRGAVPNAIAPYPCPDILAPCPNEAESAIDHVHLAQSLLRSLSLTRALKPWGRRAGDGSI